jgi:UPF0716 protein FxsA
MRWLLVAAAFIVVPLAELWAILEVGRAIGVGPTILVLLADSILGAILLRSQGRRAWARFLDALRTARVPSREVADGILILFGGALLLTPGFLTDLVGLAFLLPPSRALLRRALERGVARRMTAGLAGAGRPGAEPTTGRVDAAAPRRPFDVEGSATERGESPRGGGAPRPRAGRPARPTGPPGLER